MSVPISLIPDLESPVCRIKRENTMPNTITPPRTPPSTSSAPASPREPIPSTCSDAPSRDDDEIIVLDTCILEKEKTLKELRMMCVQLGLSDKGKKSELAERIRQHNDTVRS